MNFGSATRSVSKAEASVASNATHSLEIDTLGFAYASIDVLFTPFTAAAATAATAATVLRLAHSDTSGAAGTANLFVQGVDYTVAAGTTSTAGVGYAHRFDVDLRGKRRYLTVYATPVSTVGIVTSCNLSKGEAGPVSASDKGVNTQAVG
jgi:hypothetical protein